MDKVIKHEKRLFSKRIIFVGVTVLILFYLLSRLFFFNPDEPSIDKEKIRIGIVKQGALDVLVSGTGVVTAKDPQWMVAKVAGQIIKSNFKSGELVKKGDVVVEIANDNILSEYTKSESDLRAVHSEFSALAANLHSQRLGYESDFQAAQFDAEQAQMYFKAVEALWEKSNPPISQLEYSTIKLKAKHTEILSVKAREKLELFKKMESKQLDAFKFRLASAEETNTHLKSRMNDLKVISSTDGIIQNLNFKVGQEIKVGESIAQVINPSSIYVTFNAPAIQAFKLSAGQKVNIELNKRIVQGFVHRIDPNVKGTTVEVDVYFNDEILGAKIGMFVSGTIFIQSIPDTLYMDMPSQVAENGHIPIFLLSSDEKSAEKRIVKSGVVSSNNLQIIEGLKKGDRIILSDLSISNDISKLRLN